MNHWSIIQIRASSLQLPKKLLDYTEEYLTVLDNSRYQCCADEAAAGSDLVLGRSPGFAADGEGALWTYIVSLLIL